MTVAPQLAVGTTLDPADDVSYSIFQNIPNPNATELICGNIFLGLQGAFAVRIPLGEQLGLARGGTIETGLTNAAVTLVSTRSWSAGGLISVNCMLDDSPRNGPLDPRLAWKPPGGFGPDWRHDFWGTFDTRLENLTGTPFLDTPAFNSGNWSIRHQAGRREQLAQLFTVPAGPAWLVARAILEMRRVGNPIGSMVAAIQANLVDPYGRNVPSGIDVGVSAQVFNSTVPASPGNGPMTFTFSPQVSLNPGTYWLVLRPQIPYPVNGADFVLWLQRRQFFATQSAHRVTSDDRFNQGLFPGHVDIALDVAAKVAGTPIAWNPPATVPGQSRSTPDLSPLVQEVILRSGHETASALCFIFQTSGETRTFGFRAQGHPSGSPPGFACQFRRRDTRGEVT